MPTAHQRLCFSLAHISTGISFSAKFIPKLSVPLNGRSYKRSYKSQCGYNSLQRTVGVAGVLSSFPSGACQGPSEFSPVQRVPTSREIMEK